MEINILDNQQLLRMLFNEHLTSSLKKYVFYN